MQWYDDPVASSGDQYRPGKSAPRLVQDLSVHEIGGQALPCFPETLMGSPFEGRRHEWVADIPETQPADQEPEPGVPLNACCWRTRMHASFLLEYPSDAETIDSCKRHGKLHHFQLVDSETILAADAASKFEKLAYRCSRGRCRAQLLIQLRKAEIDQALIDAIHVIRPLATFASGPVPGDKPSRFSTFMALEYFMRHTAEFKATIDLPMPRTIAIMPTSPFMKLVGREPAITALMKRLKFTLAPADWDGVSYVNENDIVQDIDEAKEGEMIEWNYYPPDPRQPGIRDLLRRFRIELQSLAATAKQASPRDPKTESPWRVSQERAEQYWLRLMEAEARFYTKEPVPWMHDMDTADELAYAKLGTTAAFHDLALLDFYDLQTSADQRNQSWYLSALEAIANQRRSETLQMSVTQQRSMGVYTRHDLMKAYRCLDSVPRDDDETLINVAASHMLDDHDEAARKRYRDALAIIGEERDSSVIRKYLNAPQKDFPDVASALQYLGAPEQTDDEMLIFFFHERASINEQLARSALGTIADERKNTRLRRFLDTGEDTPLPSVKFTLPDAAQTATTEEAELEMLDPDLAYSRLGVDDKTVDDDMLLALFEIRSLDDPDNATVLRKALEVIGDVRCSRTIRAFLSGEQNPVEIYQMPEASLDRPVGMENIGNTCYLNSLLQYYYTIKPLRGAIMHMEEHAEQELTEEILSKKKVGGRHVSKEEVERALRFMRELKTLFVGLLSCKEASLKPSKAVCFLALVSSRDEANADQAVVDEVLEGVEPVQLVKGTGMDLPVTDTNQMVLFKGSESPATIELASTDTLMGDEEKVSQPPTSPRSPKRKLITPPSESDEPATVRPRAFSPEPMDTEEDYAEGLPVMPAAGAPLDSDTAKFVAEGTLAPSMPPAYDNIWEDLPSPTSEAKPSLSIVTGSAPVLPPRATPLGANKRRKSSLLWSDSNDWGKQQDVAECVDNVLFQISAALKPSGGHHPVDGEQMDLVKDLFFGITRQRINVPGNEPKEERFSNTIVNLEHDGQSLYDALDTVFDARLVELDSKQVLLTTLLAKAPILFQVQIQRADFDLKSMQAIKKNTYLKLDERIFLDRYMDTEDSAIQALRIQYAEHKRELHGLRTERERLQALKVKRDAADQAAKVASQKAAAPVQSAYSDHDWIASAREVGSDDGHEDNGLQTSGVMDTTTGETFTESKRHGSVHEVILPGDNSTAIQDKQAETVQEEVEPAATEEAMPTTEELDDLLETNEAQIMTLSAAALSIFDDDDDDNAAPTAFAPSADLVDLSEPEPSKSVVSHRQHAYRLSSVFMHRGAANHGHYWICIYDFANGKWRKYNDETVTDVSADEAVHKDLTGMTENPYMLTYIREDQVDRVSQALVRDWDAEPGSLI